MLVARAIDDVGKQAPRRVRWRGRRETGARAPARIGRQRELRHQQQPATIFTQAAVHASVRVGEDAIAQQTFNQTAYIGLSIVGTYTHEYQQAGTDSGDTFAVDVHRCGAHSL